MFVISLVKQVYCTHKEHVSSVQITWKVLREDGSVACRCRPSPCMGEALGVTHGLAERREVAGEN